MAEEQSNKPQAEAEPPIGFGITAFYSNRYQLWADEQTMRFVIGDSITGQDFQAKFAFVMTREDAQELANAIDELLDRTKPSQNA